MIDSSSPNQPIQNYEIVNKTLETQVAALLPSVAGYGGNLRATNTIIPIVDLTAAAEGSSLPANMQQALAFGSQTVFNVENTTTTVINSPGFYRCVGTVGGKTATSAAKAAGIKLTDGVSTKIVWATEDFGANTLFNVPFDYIIFLAAGESLQFFTENTRVYAIGSVRQVATVDGTLVTPSGF